MEELKNRRDYTQALMPDGLIVLEGTTTSCSACKAMAPTVEKLIKKFPDARFYHYDVDEADDIAQELGARVVPAFTIFKDGMLQDGVTGGKAKELEEKIRENYEGKVVE